MSLGPKLTSSCAAICNGDCGLGPPISWPLHASCFVVCAWAANAIDVAKSALVNFSRLVIGFMSSRKELKTVSNMEWAFPSVRLGPQQNTSTRNYRQRGIRQGGPDPLAALKRYVTGGLQRVGSLIGGATYIGGYIDFRQKKVQRGLSIEANTPGPPLVGEPSFLRCPPVDGGGADALFGQRINRASRLRQF